MCWASPLSVYIKSHKQHSVSQVTAHDSFGLTRPLSFDSGWNLQAGEVVVYQNPMSTAILSVSDQVHSLWMIEGLITIFSLLYTCLEV